MSDPAHNEDIVKRRLNEPVSFSDLRGWRDDDHTEAARAFLNMCANGRSAPRIGKIGIDGNELMRLCQSADARAAAEEPNRARAFFEKNFVPFRLAPPGDGFVTGYYEPEIDGSRQAVEPFTVPLYRRPDDLVRITKDNRPAPFDERLEAARQTEKGLVPYYDRSEIDAGILNDRGLELVFIESPVDAFFIHVQGSARIRLRDGSAIRVSYDGKNGHPYTSIGRVLIERGALDRDTMSMDRLRNWLNAHPEEASGVMATNRSFIFFREVSGLAPELGPVGAAGVQLTAGRSIAVDKVQHTYGSPVWVDADLPLSESAREKPFRRLMIAQDTGSAIIGSARGDVFIGSGAKAGSIAGRVRHSADMVVFVPRTQLMGRDADGVR